MRIDIFIDKSIIDILVGTLLLTDDDDEEGVTTYKDRSLAIFRKNYNGDGADVKYRLVIKCATMFQLTIGHLADALSFNQVAKTLLRTKQILKVGTLGNPSRALISEYARFIAAWNYNNIKNLLSKVWSFSIAFDGASHQSAKYIDLRVRF